jgi:hypothetical protein
VNAELERRAYALQATAEEIRIIDQPTLTGATEFLLVIKGLQKEIDKTFDPIIDAAHKAHREALTQKKRHEEPLVQAERAMKAKISSYIAEENRKREEAALIARQAVLDRRKNEEAALAAASSAEAKGDGETASFILERAAASELKIVGSVQAAPPKPITNGLSMREIWRFEVTDPASVPREFLQVDMVKVGKVVQELKANTRIPGVRVFSENVLAARAS